VLPVEYLLEWIRSTKALRENPNEKDDWIHLLCFGGAAAVLALQLLIGCELFSAFSKVENQRHDFGVLFRYRRTSLCLPQWLLRSSLA
jgi:hypothetical protein